MTLTLALLGGLLGLGEPRARADGCYSCVGGSSDHCRDYCHFAGQDTFAARRACEKKGCRISGRVACPPPGHNKIMCLVPENTAGGDASLVAAVPWCAAPARSEDGRF